MRITREMVFYIITGFVFWWFLLGGREQFAPYPDSIKSYGLDNWHRYWQESQAKNGQANVEKMEKYLGPVDASNRASDHSVYPIPMPDHGVYKTLMPN